MRTCTRRTRLLRVRARVRDRDRVRLDMPHAMDEARAVVKAEEAPPRPLISAGGPVEWERRGAWHCNCT